MTELAPILASLLGPLLQSKLAPSDASSSSSGSTSQPGSSSDTRVVVPPALPPAPSTPSVRSLSNLSMDLPFQFTYYTITGTETKSTSLDLMVNGVVTKLTAPYRRAELVSLDAVVMPLHPAYKYPQSVELVWTVSNVVPAAGDILSVFGAQLITWGGQLLSTPASVPADLKHLCPIIKDSVSHHDTPRLNLRFHQNEECVALGTKAPNCGHVIVRGVLRVSAPTNVPTKE